MLGVAALYGRTAAVVARWTHQCSLGHKISL